MAEKKRKGAADGTDIPSKKSKKSTATKAEVSIPNPSSNEAGIIGSNHRISEALPAVLSKQSRKRAADFLSDDDNDTTNTAMLARMSATTNDNEVEDASRKTVQASTKKRKKSKKPAVTTESLTADGVNGVVEQNGEEQLGIASAKEHVSTSMQAEAQRTADKELEDEFGGFDTEEAGAEAVVGESDSEEDQGAALLAGFDSDASDPDEDQGLDLSRTPALPQYKKTQKLLRKAKEQAGGNDGPGTVYIGRIPHGFYEHQMREYFSQFGDISKLRLSRNKRTGASKHFAFIEFKSNEVAKVVANTMDNYLMFGHILKCKYAPEETLHPDVWKGANKKYRKIPHEKLEREKLAAPKSEKYWSRKVLKEQRKREQKALQLAAMGYEMPKSTLKLPEAALKQKLLESENSEALKQIEAGQNTIEAPTGMIEPPPNIPKDEVALEVESKKKSKSKSKKAKSDKQTSTFPDNAVIPAPKKETKVSSVNSSKDKTAEAKTASKSDSREPGLKNKKAKKQVVADKIVEKAAPEKSTELKGILKKQKSKKA